MIEIINGNGLQINSNEGEGRLGFDRIYVGASIEKSDLTKLSKLLRPGGIIVAPGE
jgi:protein-L-isoaspartate O-methyltransferase